MTDLPLLVRVFVMVVIAWVFTLLGAALVDSFVVGWFIVFFVPWAMPTYAERHG